MLFERRLDIVSETERREGMDRMRGWLVQGICLSSLLVGLGWAQTKDRVVTLADCWGRVAEGHPLLAAAQQRVEGAEEVRRYAGLRPNPSLTIQTENWRAWQRPPFVFQTEIELFVYGTQRWETAGKTGLRREVAARGVEAAEGEVDLLRRQVWREVTRRYRVALEAQRMLEIERENRRDLAELVAWTKARFEEGYLAEWELIRVRLEEQTLLQQISKEEQAYDQARLALLQVIAEPSLRLDFRVEEPSPAGGGLALPLDELKRESIAERRELSQLRARLEVERANLRLQQANAQPDLEFSAGYKRTGIFNTLIGYVTVPLPFFQRNQGEIGRAAASLNATEYELIAQTRYIEAEVEASYRAVERLRERQREMEQDLLRRADESREIALTAYREGAADLYKVLEAQRARLEVRRLYQRTRLDLQMELAELALLIGRKELQ
jgi:cobalt-zinc-cadmium efflux system outer membrane protein